VFEKLNLQHQNLIHLLAYISANLKSDITAESVLGQPLFEGFEPPMSEYPHGLDSAPETTRGPLSECVPLMQAIDARVIHYFVDGGTIDWRGRDEKKLCTWLVYRWTEDQGWDRALFTAEKGKKGAIGAIYQNRLLSNLEADLVSNTHTLEVPCNRGCNWVGFDGLPRAVDAEQENMAKWTLGCYANSVRDQTNSGTNGINCTRDWDPDWKQYSADRSVAKPLTEARMALKLLNDVDAYVPLLYTYDWIKEKRKTADPKTSTSLVFLAQDSGRAAGKRKLHA
jgi:hypothetical protein